MIKYKLFIYCILACVLLLFSCNKGMNEGIPRLETFPASEIMQTTAKSGGRIISGNYSEIVSKGVCWSQNINPVLQSDNFTDEGQGNDPFESLITGLLPDNEYYVRAYATNSDGTGYGENEIFKTLHSAFAEQIIADHTIVDRYDDIPQQWIDSVKKMWVTNPGESHAAALRQGLMDLESLNSKFQVIVRTSGTPYSYRINELRFSGATWGDYSNSDKWIYSYGEEDWFTNHVAISRTKAGITYCNKHNLFISAIGWCWCYDDSHSSNISKTADPVYGCRWYGRSYNGPEGNRAWGLDAADQTITGNSICLDSYLNATQEYVDYCKLNGYRTKVFFTTGPVEPTYYKGEAGYQASLKHKRIRDFVKSDPSRILFDYADILCYDDGSEIMATSTWEGHTFPVITSTNYGDGNLGHIGPAGALRLAKAMWWMLARIAGWDGK